MYTHITAGLNRDESQEIKLIIKDKNAGIVIHTCLHTQTTEAIQSGGTKNRKRVGDSEMIVSDIWKLPLPLLESHRNTTFVGYGYSGFGGT